MKTEISNRRTKDKSNRISSAAAAVSAILAFGVLNPNEHTPAGEH
jgi:hypothetical protein